MATLADILKPNFITVAPEDTLREVAEKMMSQNVGAVVVKDFGRLIGILTERDMLRAMAARMHTGEARVRQWMTPDQDHRAVPTCRSTRPPRSCSTTGSGTSP